MGTVEDEVHKGVQQETEPAQPLRTEATRRQHSVIARHGVKKKASFKSKATYRIFTAKNNVHNMSV